MLYLDEIWLQDIFDEGRQTEPTLRRTRARQQRAPALYQTFCELNDLLFSTCAAEVKSRDISKKL